MRKFILGVFLLYWRCLEDGAALLQVHLQIQISDKHGDLKLFFPQYNMQQRRYKYYLFACQHIMRF